ncbi:MAG: DUF4446 family protein [Lachnospiraceae bacterium]|nr:DUF4446 family protein [Lachnospiraceae bacterium]
MFETYLGIPTDYIVIGVAGFAILLLILILIQSARISGLKKRYESFMKGKNVKSLEDTLIYRLEKVDELDQKNENNERLLKEMKEKMVDCYQKMGLLKYDALDEMGGKLSYTLALLNEKNNGFVMNCVHSREGSYSYIKEIIDGNSIVGLSPEEDEALQKALNGED